jgi:CheY-like chemotaxis protein
MATAMSAPTMRAKTATASGWRMDDYVTKPIRVDELIGALQHTTARKDP